MPFSRSIAKPSCTGSKTLSTPRHDTLTRRHIPMELHISATPVSVVFENYKPHNVKEPAHRTSRSTANSFSQDPYLGLGFDVAHTLGGARRDRTDDLMLAKHALSQLSYGPEVCLQGALSARGASAQRAKAADAAARRLRACQRQMVGPGRLELPTLRLSGVRSNHLSYGPGGHERQPDRPSARPDPGEEKRRRRSSVPCGRCLTVG